jgi:hypothetical protein
VLPTTVRSATWIVSMLLFTIALVAKAVAREAHEARIPHQDGTGTSTVVEIEKNVPGALDFVRATPGPVPRPGEIIVPTRTVQPTPSLTPTPSRAD